MKSTKHLTLRLLPQATSRLHSEATPTFEERT
jgi:hypothetical protein